MKNKYPPPPDVHKLLKNALKLPDSIAGWVGLSSLVLMIILLLVFA